MFRISGTLINNNKGKIDVVKPVLLGPTAEEEEEEEEEDELVEAAAGNNNAIPALTSADRYLTAHTNNL